MLQLIFILGGFLYYNLFTSMASRLGLLLAATVLVAMLMHHRVIFKITPYILSNILRRAHLPSPDHIEALQLETLGELTEIPLIGEFFLEEKVKALVKRKQWKDVLRECSKEDGILWRESQKLLPLRAIAECATFQFLKCESTLATIKENTPHLADTIRPLFQLYDSLIDAKEEKAERNRSLEISEW